MLFYFAWIEENEIFNPQIHAREDLEIFNLQITEHEGQYPTAAITVRALHSNDRKPYAMISCRAGDTVQLFFKGRLVRFPIALDGETHTLEFIAEPSDAEVKLKEIAEFLQQLPYYDPLFLSQDQRLEPDIHELLDARDDLLYWSRTMDGVRLSNIFQGSQRIDLNDRFFYNSLAIHLIDAPLKQVDVELQMQWRQRFRGEAFLDHLLQAALPEGMISSLTGSDLEARWWRDGDAIGRSGYQLTHSALKKVDTDHTNIPKTSQAFWVSPHDPLSKQKKDKMPRKIRLKKSWYRPQLKVSWRYCQKRVEKVFLSLRQDVQSLGYHPERKRTLRLKVHDIVAEQQYLEWQANRLQLRGEKVVHDGQLFLCLRTHRASDDFSLDAVNWQGIGAYREGCTAEARGTFFATDRGAQAVEHAIEIARAHLAASARAVEVKFVCSFVDALSVTCDHTLTIADERLPGKHITGKVKKLVFEVNGQTGCATATLTLACSLGTGRNEACPLEKSVGYAEDYWATEVIAEKAYRATVSGVSYRSFYDQLPERGHTFPAFLGASDILRGVTVVNTASEQEDVLAQKQYPHGHNLQQALRQVKTGVKLWFEDLRSVGALEHHIHVQIPQAWSAPKQMEL